MDIDTDTQDVIRDRAYALWVAAGSPEGNDLQFWHQAEQELASEPGAAPVSDEAETGASADTDNSPGA